MPAPADGDNYRDILTGIAEHATGAVVTLMQQYDTTPTPELRDVLLEGYPQIIDSYVAAAQDVSAEFYTQLKPDSDFVAESGDLPDAGDLAKTVNWAFNQDDPEAALAGLHPHLRRRWADGPR